MTEFICKTTPSPLDERDWAAESIYDTSLKLPKKLDLRDDMPYVRNQGSLGTCAAQTAAAMKEWQEKKNVDYSSHMSPMFVYNNRENKESEGMHGRDVMRILKNIGCCREMTYPYLTTVPIDEPILKEAENGKIKGYARVHTIDTLKRALFINGPCYISFPVYNRSTRMWIPSTGQKQEGGHAMTVVGYNNEGFIVRNSWGFMWGKNGCCIYPYSDWGAHYEIWTTMDDKSSTPFTPTFDWTVVFSRCLTSWL